MKIKVEFPICVALTRMWSGSLQWPQNGRDSVSNHQPHDCLFNHLFTRRSMKTLEPLVTGLCAGNSPGTGEFPAQMASNAKKFSFDGVIMCHAVKPKTRYVDPWLIMQHVLVRLILACYNRTRLYQCILLWISINGAYQCMSFVYIGHLRN